MDLSGVFVTYIVVSLDYFRFCQKFLIQLQQYTECRDTNVNAKLNNSRILLIMTLVRDISFRN